MDEVTLAHITLQSSMHLCRRRHRLALDIGLIPTHNQPRDFRIRYGTTCPAKSRNLQRWRPPRRGLLPDRYAPTSPSLFSEHEDSVSQISPRDPWIACPAPANHHRQDAPTLGLNPDPGLNGILRRGSSTVSGFEVIKIGCRHIAFSWRRAPTG